jgi:hypothetical protein
MTAAKEPKGKREMSIAEGPTTLLPGGRSRALHLRSWRNGWRHLRFLMLFSSSAFSVGRGWAFGTLGSFVISLFLSILDLPNRGEYRDRLALVQPDCDLVR